MAFPVLKMLFTLNVFLLICALQVNCKVEKYALNVVENGTSVNEEVEVDVDEQTEVIRVPKHGDKNGMEQLNDFIRGLSARRDSENKVCYVSKLDSSFPSPGEMKQDMDKVLKQSQPAEETTENSEWKVVGPVNSTVLPQKILEFCGTFPIYEIGIEDNPLENTTLPEKSSEARSKRSSGYNFCSYSDQWRRDSCRSYSLDYRWKYVIKYCNYIYVTKCYSTGWFWRSRRVCKCYRVRKCIYIRTNTRCYSVTCHYDYTNDYTNDRNIPIK